MSVGKRTMALAGLLLFSVLLSACGNVDTTASTPDAAGQAMGFNHQGVVYAAKAAAPDQQTAVLQLVQAMFNAAPGAEYLNQFSEIVAGGMSMAALADLLARSEVFRLPGLYPETLTHQMFADKFVDNLTGSTVSGANKAWVAAYIADQLDNGKTKGDVIWWAVSALAAVAPSDADWGNAAAQLNNRVDVSYYYSVTKALSSADLSTLQAVTASVTDDPATVTAAMDHVNAANSGSITVKWYLIVDTGQTKYYGNGSELAVAPGSASSAFYGQDAQFSGSQPAYRNNGDGTVTDLHTGLMWVSARGPKMTWDEAAAGATMCAVGGYGDWRMPTIKELYSLIQFTGKSGATDATSIPYIDTNYFEIVFGDVTGGRVIDGQDWSATQYVSTTMNGDATVFGVNFIDGRIKGYPKYQPGSATGNTLYVRYVRGNGSYGVNQFTDNGNGTITDKATGLMWSQSDSGTAKNWQDALAWVQAQNSAHYLGYNDWRMPDAKELQSIVDYTRSPEKTGSAAINPLFLSTAITNEGGVSDYPWYWAGTTHLDSSGGVYVCFGRALGWMKLGSNSYYSLLDVHGAGAQRSDPKNGNVANYFMGYDAGGTAVYGLGPQGDVIRIVNFVRLVRNTP